jgi:hypothetical protein
MTRLPKKTFPTASSERRRLVTGNRHFVLVRTYQNASGRIRLFKILNVPSYDDKGTKRAKTTPPPRGWLKNMVALCPHSHAR